MSVYPLKSSSGIGVERADVGPAGLVDDRRWAVVDSAGEIVTAREKNRLLQVVATVEGSALVLSAPGGASPCRVPVPAGGRCVDVAVSRMPQAIDAGPAAATWLSAILGQAVRLVWQEDPRARTVSAQHGGLEGDHLNLADAGPVLLTTTASLDRLNSWIGERDPSAHIAMERFRPNIVVEGSPAAFVEDRWRRIRIGNLEYRYAEICDRCVIPMIDPVTLVHGKEPIRTLAQHRRWDGATWFGVRMVPLGAGTVRVGDEVTVSEEDEGDLPPGHRDE